MKFLIIRFSSIGDIVLTSPVVRCLKKQIITAEVHYLTKKNFAPLFTANPYIDRMYYLEDDLDAVIEGLRKEDYDYVIDLHHNLRTLKVKKALGKKSFSFNKLNVQKWVYVNFRWNIMPDAHIVDRYMETVQQFGVKNDNAGLDYFIPQSEQVKESDIPTSHHAGYIGLVIGGAHNTKKYPAHKHKQLCSKLDHPVIILGGPEDVAHGDEIASVDPGKIYNACGKFSLNESADLIRRSKLVMTNDTGLMHIAAAFRKPIISLWGNTVPEFGMTPYFGMVDTGYGMRDTGDGIRDAGYGMRDTRFEIRDLPCRPCSKIGYDKCPRGHFKCMELIDPESIVETTEKILTGVK